MSTIAAPQNSPENRKKITTLTFRQMKAQGRKITMLTGYDYATALALDHAGLDAILVGDSLGMVMLGYENTLPVTMEEILLACKAVRRGARTSLLIGDLPFMSYQVSIPEAVRNAGRLLQEGGMDAVKLEGGRNRVETIRAIVGAGIPVMGHLGLTPQSIHQIGGFRPQARKALAARRLVEDALLLQEAGCFSLVLESIPARLAGYVSERLEIPTIGIGAGAGCDGQVLVVNDMLGSFERFTPSFVRQYAQLGAEMQKAFAAYIADVQAGYFPTAEHTVEMKEDEWQAFLSTAQAGGEEGTA